MCFEHWPLPSKKSNLEEISMGGGQRSDVVKKKGPMSSETLWLDLDQVK